MRQLLLGAAILGSISCGDLTLEPLPFQVTITATPTTAAVGQPVGFVILAQGGALQQAGIDFDDGTTDGILTNGARTARVTFNHSFAAAGTYDVIGTVIDDLEGPRSATVQVVVQ